MNFKAFSEFPSFSQADERYRYPLEIFCRSPVSRLISRL